MTAPYRKLPAVDALVRSAIIEGGDIPRDLLVAAARATLDAARQAIRDGYAAPAPAALAAAAVQRARTWLTPSLRPLINASGVILQTNLGRAPLSAAALAAMQAVGSGYSNLEYDITSGVRGSRSSHLTALLCRLTGAESALAVNNNAAAIYLVLLALAGGHEVIVSRGQAVEIGGGFRIPEVLPQSGAPPAEVGTTNRTYASNYEAAIGPPTALLMRIHTSNFRLSGFVHETSLADMVAVGRAHGVAVLDDLGSGTLLPTAPYGLAAEPTVQESIIAGADLVCFSGDKLLGGPQAGLIVGRADLINRLRQHPLARALRIDKTTIAGLEATLLSYLRGRAVEEIPIWRMIATPVEQLRQRAERIAARISGATIATTVATIGGGSLPGETLPSIAVALPGSRPDTLAQVLRCGDPPIIARITDAQLLIDLRSVPEEADLLLAEAILAALA
ncbi:MAG TPA: L-seryl-tRNA(Sec) selenium transferase [Roseiflexaceae bacterium]|mgnify:CR=1 FL=1|nr:L-seryl-tRNA(Sec) selenium transferase [Roseiflexaceae bacterium]